MASSEVKVTEGKVPFSYPTFPKPCETWYKVYGDLKSSTTGRPLVLLHGGPGAGHNYLLPLAGIVAKHGIPVVFYDQVGCGNSTRLKEKRNDHEFWTVDVFMTELDNLVSHLGISDSFDVLGQSWGGMLAGSIAIRGHTGLKKLVIANSPAAIRLWLDGCNHWRTFLPEDIEAALVKHEAARTYEDPEYLNAVMFFYKLHMCRVQPFPEPVQQTMDLMEADNDVYFTMNGPSEFTVIGNLKEFDIIADLHKITIPTLVINAEYDCATDEAVKPFVDEIKGAKWHKFEGCSHMSHVEANDESIELIAGFLKE